MPKIILWKDFNFKDDSFYKKIKNIKDNSLICSFSTNLQRNFFKTITRKGGKVLLALKKTTIVGLLVMEKKSSHTLDFLKKNLIKIILNLLFSKYWSDKKILFNYFINFLFMKENKILIKNNIVLVAVISSERGKKIGNKLIKKLKKITNKNIYVTTDYNNYKAQNFYKKNNFKFFNETFYGIRKLCIYKYKKNKLN